MLVTSFLYSSETETDVLFGLTIIVIPMHFRKILIA